MLILLPKLVILRSINSRIESYEEVDVAIDPGSVAFVDADHDVETRGYYTYDSRKWVAVGLKSGQRFKIFGTVESVATEINDQLISERQADGVRD